MISTSPFTKLAKIMWFHAELWLSWQPKGKTLKFLESTRPTALKLSRYYYLKIFYQNRWKKFIPCRSLVAMATKREKNKNFTKSSSWKPTDLELWKFACTITWIWMIRQWRWHLQTDRSRASCINMMCIAIYKYTCMLQINYQLETRSDRKLAPSNRLNLSKWGYVRPWPLLTFITGWTSWWKNS